MKHRGAWLWLAAVILVSLYLALRLSSGLTLQSSIFALLPRTERDQASQAIQDRIAASLSRRVVFLIGDKQRDVARASAQRFSFELKRSKLVTAVTSDVDPGAQRKFAAAYFPYRMGLLSDRDRERLLANDAGALTTRARSILYGSAGFANSQLLAHDPFFLFPAFLFDISVPQSRLALDDGVLSVQEGETSYVLVSAELAGDPFSTPFQDRFENFVNGTMERQIAARPDLKFLRAGAVFYAHDGASEATNETSLIGTISIIATVLLILLVFRHLRPILLGLLAIGTGILCAFAGTLALFGGMHAIALLFGVSLIGVSIDYSLQYFCEYFDPGAMTPGDRLKRVLPGVAIGLTTTLIGYLTLLLAPFPGLRQVAAFSVIGLIASVLTVVFWYPLLDRAGPSRPGSGFVRAAALHWTLWESRGLAYARLAIIALCLLLAFQGAFVLHTDDDVRHLQSLSPELKHEDADIQRLIGSTENAQFLIVRGGSEQKLLETEEALASRLHQAEQKGVLSQFETVAQLVPSISRQKENRRLVATRLYSPYLAPYLSQIGYQGRVDYAGSSGFLTPAALPPGGPFGMMSLLSVGSPGHPAHVVMLGTVKNAPALKAQIADIPGVQLVNLTDDWSALFGAYRRYALILLAFSALLMFPVLGWRYGWLSGLRVMAPAIAAAILAPPIAALAGVAFTFFNAMALVLTLSIGVDYSVFCRETSGARKPVTMLAIALAALSTILSFGLLALSRVYAVHAFGTTMLIGIILSFLFAPLAGDATAGPRRRIGR